MVKESQKEEMGLIIRKIISKLIQKKSSAKDNIKYLK